MATVYQQNQASRQSQRNADRAGELATASALDRYASISQRQRLAREGAASDIDQVVRQSLQAQGQARVAAAEAGASGEAVDGLLRDFERQELEFRNQTERNLDTADFGLEQEGRAIQNQTESRFSQIQASVTPPPNFLNALIRIGGTAVQQNTARQQRQNNAGLQ